MAHNYVTNNRRARPDERYILTIGLPGCLPDTWDSFATYAEARAGVEWWKNEYREAGYRVVGNLKHGFWEIYRENETYPSLHMNLSRQSFTEEELAEIDAEY